MPHEYKVKRKLQEQGGSYFIFLPKLWVESLGLEEGDLMSVEFNGIVKVKPPNKLPKSSNLKECTLMTQRKPALSTRVSPIVNTAVRQLTKALGITISEYLRKLILQDLDSRKMFQDELKKAVEQSEANDVTQRPRPRASAHTITQQALVDTEKRCPKKQTNGYLIVTIG